MPLYTFCSPKSCVDSFRRFLSFSRAISAHMSYGIRCALIPLIHHLVVRINSMHRHRHQQPQHEQYRTVWRNNWSSLPQPMSATYREGAEFVIVVSSLCGREKSRHRGSCLCCAHWDVSAFRKKVCWSQIDNSHYELKVLNVRFLNTI